jgi:hypothetical protein
MEGQENKNLEDVLKSDWYKELPQVVKDTIETYPPGLYKMRDTGKQCFIIGYIEPDPEHKDPKFHVVTFIVMKTGIGGIFPIMDKGSHVHGVSKGNLESWKDDEQG